MSYVVAITGGIGSGKTTVANTFQQNYGVNIVDADVIARQVVEPNTPGLAAIIEHFGTSILLQNGRLNRTELRQRIFSTPEEKKWINALLHPLIIKEMQHQLSLSESSYTLLVVPLLVENKLQYLADRVLVVDVLQQTQIDRTTHRDHVSIEQVKAILKSQVSKEERLAIADDVINNDYPTHYLKQEIALLHNKYLLLSQKS